jgi:hypothetical protein
MLCYDECDCEAPIICVEVSDVTCFIDSDLQHELGLGLKGTLEICMECKSVKNFMKEVEKKVKPITDKKKKEVRMEELVENDELTEEEEKELQKLEDEGIEV